MFEKPVPLTDDIRRNGTPPTPPDPFDPESLRLSDDYLTSLGVRKVLLTLPIRKPDKAWFFRVHPDDKYSIQTAVIELKEDREVYLVSPGLRPELAGEATLSPRLLCTAMNRQGVLFLWPIRLPGVDGKIDEWSRSALEAADLAKKGWVRVTSNMSLGAYEVFEATGDLPTPEWPDMPLKELLRIAFKDKFIDSVQHPVIRKLRGEV